jgi:hypothetical protein
MKTNNKYSSLHLKKQLKLSEKPVFMTSVESNEDTNKQFRNNVEKEPGKYSMKKFWKKFTTSPENNAEKESEKYSIKKVWKQFTTSVETNEDTNKQIDNNVAKEQEKYSIRKIWKDAFIEW